MLSYCYYIPCLNCYDLTVILISYAYSMAFDLLTLEMHHRVCLYISSMTSYVYGTISYHDNYDLDEMCLIKLENLAKDLGYQKN